MSDLIPEEGKLAALMSAADTLSQLDEALDQVEQRFGLPDRIQEDVDKLMAFRTQGGDSVPRELAEQAVRLSFERRYEKRFGYPGPLKGLRAKLWNAYITTFINRVRIGMCTGVTVLGLGVLYGSVEISQAVALHRAERGVESRIEDAYQQQARLHAQVTGLRDSAPLQLADSDPLTSIGDVGIIIDSSDARLKSADAFFSQWCPNGSAMDAVTRDNYHEADQQLTGILTHLTSIRNGLNTGRGIMQTYQERIQLSSSLDTLIETIRGLEAPSLFRDQAESIYATGVSNIKQNRMPEGRGAEQQLQSLTQDIRDYRVLPDRGEQSYRNILSVVQEAAAQQQADSLYANARQQIQQLQVGPLRTTTEQLSQLEANLNLEYNVLIVSRPGEYTYFDMIYEGTGNTSGFYVVVEARDTQGNVIPRTIADEQQGHQLRTVTMWAERIPESVFNRIADDKDDNGIVDADLFAFKPRGYLSETTAIAGTNGMPIERSGQITQWERP